MTGSRVETQASVPLIVAFARRERSRTLLRNAFPRRRGRLVFARTTDEVGQTLRTSLVDAVVIDLAGSQEETWAVSALAAEHPATAFFGMTPLRAADAVAIADCARRDFAGIVLEGVDDAVAREIIIRSAFSTRFARALRHPPATLALSSTLQLEVWRLVLTYGGRPVRTSAIAAEVGLTREHLSRSFASNGSPNLKRVIDLVRIVAAAELAKNPGLDLRDVSQVLGFASPSHLSTTAMRIAGTKPVSLTRLRAVDIFDRFARGNARSRG